MKKTGLLLVFLAVFLHGNTQTWVQVPDPNFQSYLSTYYPNAVTTMGGNFYIDQDHPGVTAVTYTDVSSRNIADLSGIEAFVNLTNLICDDNQLTTLTTLPSGLWRLACENNQLTTLLLPSGLLQLYCDNNQLATLPEIPSGVVQLTCDNNQLTTLPTLPSGLSYFSCTNNQLTTLPTLPSGLNSLYCNNNQLTTLPALPSGLNSLYCYNNQITCFPEFPQSLTVGSSFAIYNNPFTCLPNYVTAMNNELAYPLCADNDPVNNPNACSAATGITGTVFNDVNNNCVNSGSGAPHISLQLLDSVSNLLQSGSSFVNGSYRFTPGPGNYTVKVDDTNLPLGVQIVCPLTNEYTVNLTSAASTSSGNDFGLQCTGFDLGVQSIYTLGWVFPGQTHVATIEAGDLGAYFGLDCVNGIGGDITVSVNGPGTVLSFGGSPSSVSGNSAVYSVTDFGGFLSHFTAQILTDTTAQAGDPFCITVTISTSTAGELDTTNNTYVFCYNVINSYDPNIKQTTPELVEPGYEDEFTYTIYFQNTGSAPAFNIRLEDVLDNNLDLTTFRVVKASHDYKVNVYMATRKLVVRYPNIMLPDSTSDAEGSIGFVQYRIKPLTGLPLGTVIENTAAIYFDYNEPIITNTTQNTFNIGLGIKNTTVQTVSLFPNPANGKITIRSSERMENIEIYSVNGRLYHSMVSADKEVTLSLTELPEGIYIAKVLSKNGVSTARFIKK